MGASHIPTKGKRTDYSLQDDQIVYDYLYPYEQGQGMPISGNRIYKALSQKVWLIPSLNQLAILIPLNAVSPTSMAILAISVPKSITRKATSRGRRPQARLGA